MFHEKRPSVWPGNNWNQMPLTPKQQAFVGEYLKDLNATQAAVRAGYSEKTAKEQGYRLLTNVHIQAEVNKAKEERSGRTQIDADYVLTGIQSIVEATRKEKPDTALRGYELLGKHLELFTEKQKVTGEIAHRVVSDL